MALTGTVVDWPLIWAIWGGAFVICGLGVLTGWAVRSAWKLSKRKDV